VTATLIVPFEVAPEDDDAFLAAWPDTTATLHRALRPDADFRFVALGGAEPPRTPFASHPARYDVVHDDGAVGDAGGTVLINPFEVPPEDDDAFLAAWDAARVALAGERGYLGTRLHRAAQPDARFRFVNVARWSSPLMFSQAVQRDAFLEAAAAMSFTSHPALYLVVDA
jgi:heme-degrading monooxygenase HmoA